MFNKLFLSAVCIMMSIMALVWFTDTANAGAVKSGLIAYWTFDENTIEDQTVEDVWGENHGEIKGDPEVVEGQIGEALLLDGDVDCVIVSSEAQGINRDYSEITLECWVYINALDDSWNRILSLDGRAAGIQNEKCAVLYYDDDDDYHAFCINTSFNEMESRVQEDIPTEQWLHLLGTWDGQTAKFYENGELKTSFETEGNLKDGTFGVGIGDRGDAFGGDTIQGMIDEVRIYERALSETEAKQNFTAKGLAVEPNLKLSLTWGQMKTSGH